MFVSRMTAIPFPNSVIEAMCRLDYRGWDEASESMLDKPFIRMDNRAKLQTAFEEMIKCGIAREQYSQHLGELSVALPLDTKLIIIRLDHQDKPNE